MKFVDYSKKNVKWWNRNYFWCVSIVYIVVNIVLFAILGRNNLMWAWIENKWTVFNGIKELFISIGNSFTHNHWPHVLGNMVAFACSAFYIERKLGSLNFVGIIILMSTFSSTLTSMYVGLDWCGSSVVYFAAWGFVLIDWLFSLRKNKRTKTNTIIGAIVVSALYLGSCVSEAENAIGFTISIEPVQLVYNAGHYYGFLVGVILSLIIQIVALQIEKTR